MASPGWYPDPSGQPNRFRFWDGQAWSQQTTADPYNTPPPGQAPPPTQPPGQAPGQAQPQGQPPQQQPSQPWAQQPQQPGQPPAQQQGWSQAGQGYGAAAGQSASQPQQPGQPQPSGQPQQPGQPGQPGHQWSPMPPRGAGDGGDGSGSGKKTLIAVIGVIVVIALIIGGIVAALALTGGDDDADASGGDESSQSSDPSDSESESGGESGSPDAESESGEAESTDPDAGTKRPVMAPECTAGAPMSGKSKSTGKRIVGGGLSFVGPKGYQHMPLEKAFTFARDVSVTAKGVETYWVSTLAVAQLRKADGFTGPKQAADAVMDCMAASDKFYSNFKSRKDLVSEKGTVNKKKGWRVRSEIRIDDPRVKAEGDVAEVIVVKLDKARFGVFIGVAPIGNDQLIKVLDQTVKTLRVE